MQPFADKIMVQNNLCKTPTGIDAKMMIISNEVSMHIDYTDWMRIFMFKDTRDRLYLQSEIKK